MFKKLKQMVRLSKGFSLVELLVVISIIVLLTTVGVMSYRTTSRNGRNAKRKSDLETVQQAMVLYRADNGMYPQATGSTPQLRFINVLVILETDGYIQDTSIMDPIDEPPHQYRLNLPSGGYELSVNLETEGAAEVYELES